MGNGSNIIDELTGRYGKEAVNAQPAADGIPTVWVPKDRLHEILLYLKKEVRSPYRMLYDLFAIDERIRALRPGQAESDFTVVYHLLSFERNEDVRIKVALKGEHPSLASSVSIWPSANWYEREAWDMFGITFEGHPHLTRILMPPTWSGHPLRKDHPARATEMEAFQLPEEKEEKEERALRFIHEEWGMKRSGEDTDFMFLNLGPQHPGTHGLLRLILE